MVFVCFLALDFIGFAQSSMMDHDLTKKAEVRSFIAIHGQSSVVPEGGRKLVRIIYLVPSDKAIRGDYINALQSAILNIREFYEDSLGAGNEFGLKSPIVEVHQTNHTEGYYSTNEPYIGAPYSGWFWENALSEAFALTGGYFNDPNNKWIVYIDAQPACTQYIGATSGVGLLAKSDLRGLSGEPHPPLCGNPPETSNLNRWIGGSAHELGHAFNLPHPWNCDSVSGCSGGLYSFNSLMYMGYSNYPDTYILPCDNQNLLDSGFFTAPLNLNISVAGRVTSVLGNPIGSVRLKLMASDGTIRSTLSSPLGYYSFNNLPRDTSYTLQTTKNQYVFSDVTFQGSVHLCDVDIRATY